jgi:uncharacterized repeat protein (TIGR03803 family)
MKPVITPVPWLTAALVLLAATTQAQTYTNLYAFSNYGFDSANGSATNNDGAELYGGLVLSSNVLYGAAWEGGTNGNGTVYAVNTDGSGFRVLHTFGPPYVTYGGINSDGAFPHDTLALGDNVLYGTTTEGGTNGYGTVFRLNTDGTSFMCLHSFSLGSDGINPNAGLLLSGNTLYGTASYGGAGSGAGAVFELNTNGTGYKLLHSFGGGSNDGGFPNGGLVLSGGTLYGTSSSGGALGRGVVFALSTNGTGNGSGYTNLYVFTGTNSPYAITTNNNGETPISGLTLSGNTLYGTTTHGGTNSNGIIFSIETNGMNFLNLYTFSATTNSYNPTNSDGADPLGALFLSDGVLYGTALGGGTNAEGTVFAINTDGTGFKTLYNFIPIEVFVGPNLYSYGGDGPEDGVILSSNTLYGTTFYGGNIDGNVFALILSSSTPTVIPIPLNVQVSGRTLLLDWNSSGFSLQSASSVGGPYTNVPAATSPYIVSPTNSQQFFRLQAN